MSYEQDERLRADARRRQEIAERYAREQEARRQTLEQMFKEHGTQAVKFEVPKPSPTPRKK